MSRRAPSARRWWLVAAMVVLVALGVVVAKALPGRPSADSASAVPVTLVRDEPAPPLEGSTLDGAPFDLAALRGQPVVVNVWASWCAPCREELPLLAETARRYREAGLRVVALAMRDDAASARALLGQVAAPELTVVTDPEGTRAIQWGVRGVPETFLVDRDGHVRVHAVGALTRQWIDRQLPQVVRP
ncbi:TlpA family protein disulfide reductase [Amycolatopsis thermoflava]|uniref:TlpA family protein disulfide reductase n=1 Tax=Amycolatopsis thermoflava TaxID=84480 RepID=UPI003EBAB851